jgi:hypothetical protein
VCQPFVERRRSSAQKYLSETSVLILPRANSPASLRRWDTLPRCFCRLTESPVAREVSPSSRSRTQRLLQKLSRNSMVKSSTAGIFASPRPRIARGLPWVDTHLQGPADTRSQSQRAVAGTSEARSGASRQTAHCRSTLDSYAVENPVSG